ncbi:MAG: sulfite exporter TauE/SafE family protein [Planctomycetes bacterium]|nr:sulfite exporter TauE/SafE family protein [Planctomycetota bacterium]
MSNIELISLVVVGFVAGGMGGLLGIGGSIVMIPVLTLVFGHNQHLAQAAAMIVNIFVAVPAVIQHHRAKAVHWDSVRYILPFGIVFILVGVELSNKIDGPLLQRLFGAFLLYVIYMNFMKLIDKKDDPTEKDLNVRWYSCGFVGSITGFCAGLLGIGGGPVANPLLQRICRLPLRQTIATSSAVMCLTALVGAARKNMTLADLTPALSIKESLLVAACLAPTAAIGALVGAGLTHALPVRWVRVAFILLMVWASANMLGVV